MRVLRLFGLICIFGSVGAMYACGGGGGGKTTGKGDMATTEKGDMSGAHNSDMPAGGGCGAVDETGTCSGMTLEYCQDGELVTQDCAADSKACKLDEYDQYYVCSSCGTETYAGHCNGNTVVFCADGEIQMENCEDAGTTCVTSGGDSHCLTGDMM